MPRAIEFQPPLILSDVPDTMFERIGINVVLIHYELEMQ
jgi:hypothetical protein